MSSAGVQSNFRATVSLLVRQQWSITWFLFSLQSPAAQISRSGCGIGCLWNKSTGLQDSAHHILPCRVQHPGRVAQSSYSPFRQFGFCCVWAGFCYCLLAYSPVNWLCWWGHMPFNDHHCLKAQYSAFLPIAAYSWVTCDSLVRVALPSLANITSRSSLPHLICVKVSWTSWLRLPSDTYVFGSGFLARLPFPWYHLVLAPPLHSLPSLDNEPQPCSVGSQVWSGL